MDKKNISNVGKQAIVVSYKPLSGQQLDVLKKTLSKIYGKELTLTNNVDKKLLGGFFIKIEDWFFDGTLLNQLKKLKQNLLSE